MPAKLKKNSKTKSTPKQVYLVVVVWLVMVGVSVGVGWPSWQKIQQSNNHIEKKVTELSKLMEKQNALSSLDESELEEKVQRTIQVLPIQQDFAGYLASIKHLANKNNIIVRGYSLSPGLIEGVGLEEEADRDGTPDTSKVPEKKINKGLQVFEIETILSGNAEDVSRFFSDVERSAPVVSVPEAKMTADSPSGGLQNVTAKLVFKAYYQPLPGSLPPITSKLPVLSDKESQFLNELFEYEMAPGFVANEGDGSSLGKTNVFEQ